MNLKKKMLLLLPLLVLPFTTLLFWSLGGGTARATQSTVTTKGLNTELPNANNKEASTDKMSFYDLARKDSIDKAQALSMDPYNKAVQAGLSYEPYKESTLPEEAKLHARMSQVEKLISEPPAEKHITRSTTQYRDQSLEEPVATKDPELEQLSGMIDKIMQLQQPAQSKTKAGDTETSKTLSTTFTAITAVIPETQVLVSGSVIRLRLTNELALTDSDLLHTGAIVYGITTLEGERLHVQVPSVRIGNRIVPANLSIFDNDGMEGIYIPGAISREVAKESGNDAINSIELGTLDPSLKGQAASAGIKAARNLLSRKIKLTRLTVPAGHQVYLQQKK
jgi:hypothetical protein